MMKTISQKLLKRLTQDLIKIVTIDEVLREENGELFIGKRKLTREEITTLKAEAKSFGNSLFYNLLLKNLYWLANYKMMKEADKEMEMVNGRMMTYTIESIQQFVEKFSLLK